MARLFVMVFGNTMNSHKTFMEDLTQSPELCEVDSMDKCDVFIAFVVIESQAGTDIKAALQGIPESRPAVLVVLHHTEDPHFVAPDSRLNVNRSNVLAVDCLFHGGRGLLRCQRNDEALEAVKKHLGEEKTFFEEPITSHHLSKLNKVHQEAQKVLQHCLKYQRELLGLFAAFLLLTAFTCPIQDVIPWMFALACISSVYLFTPSEYIHSSWHIFWMLLYTVVFLKWSGYEEWIPWYGSWVPGFIFTWSFTVIAFKTRGLTTGSQ